MPQRAVTSTRWVSAKLRALQPVLLRHPHVRERDQPVVHGTLRDFDPREVKVAQAIVEQSREVWLVADQAKFDRQALVRITHLSQIDKLFCDAPPPPGLASMLAEAQVEVVVAP